MLLLQWGVWWGGRGTQQVSQLVFVGLSGSVIKEQINYHVRRSLLVFMSKYSMNEMK